MKAFSTVTLFIMAFTLFSSKANAANITFEAGDNTTATKLCVAAVSNDLPNTKLYISRLALLAGVNAGMYAKTKFATDDILCNDTNLVQFTAQYNATDTFEFINKRAEKKYRLSTDEVKVIDLARKNAPVSAPKIIVITSR